MPRAASMGARRVLQRAPPRVEPGDLDDTGGAGVTAEVRRQVKGGEWVTFRRHGGVVPRRTVRAWIAAGEVTGFLDGHGRAYIADDAKLRVRLAVYSQAAAAARKAREGALARLAKRLGKRLPATHVEP